MSGTVIRVIEDFHYDFSGLGASGSQYVIPAQRIDASQYREGGLLVRVIDINIANSGSSQDDIQVSVVEDAWDPFSGATYFNPMPSEGAVPSIAYPVVPTSLNPTAGTAVPGSPYALFFPLTTPFGGLLQIILAGIGYASRSVGDALDVQLNADLILKD